MEEFAIVMTVMMGLVLSGLVSVAIQIADIRDRVRHLRQTLETVDKDST